MIGIDIENISRFKKLYNFKKEILKKMFHACEWSYALKKSNPPQTLTGIWCAKEAVVKATSSHEKIFIKDIIIMHRESGQPYVVIKNISLDCQFINISISHSLDYATGIAILQINKS